MFVGGSGRSDKNGLAAGAAASAESNTFITFQIIIFRVDPDGRYSQRAERSGAEEGEKEDIYASIARRPFLFRGEEAALNSRLPLKYRYSVQTKG